jgi:hypothetical protein
MRDFRINSKLSMPFGCRSQQSVSRVVAARAFSTAWPPVKFYTHLMLGAPKWLNYPYASTKFHSHASLLKINTLHILLVYHSAGRSNLHLSWERERQPLRFDVFYLLVKVKQSVCARLNKVIWCVFYDDWTVFPFYDPSGYVWNMCVF